VFSSGKGNYDIFARPPDGFSSKFCLPLPFGDGLPVCSSLWAIENPLNMDQLFLRLSGLLFSATMVLSMGFFLFLFSGTCEANGSVVNPGPLRPRRSCYPFVDTLTSLALLAALLRVLEDGRVFDVHLTRSP